MYPDLRKSSPVLHTSWKKAPFLVFFLVLKLRCLTCSFISAPSFPNSALNVSACTLSRVRLFVTPGTVAHQAPLSMGFSRQEYWSGLPFPSPGDLPDPGIDPHLLHLLHWQADSFTVETPGTPLNVTLCEFWYPPSSHLHRDPKWGQGRMAAWDSEAAGQVHLLLTDGLELLTSSLEFQFLICEMVIPSACRLGGTTQLYGSWLHSRICSPPPPASPSD